MIESMLTYQEFYDAYILHAKRQEAAHDNISVDVNDDILEIMVEWDGITKRNMINISDEYSKYKTESMIESNIYIIVTNMISKPYIAF